MIKVISSGMFTTVQDLGRKGYQAYGVPLAGAMDVFAAKSANILAGNDENEALLEFTIAGGSYLFENDTLISITGADMKAQCDSRELRNWSSHKIKKGQTVSFSFVQEGCRAYMAVAGGFDIPLVMGSASTHTRSKSGGMAGRALQKGDCLAIKKSAYDKEIALPKECIPSYDDMPIIRVIPGPQDDYFTDDSFDILTSGEYTIEADSDRMGYRLKGNALKHKTSADIISDALFKGAVQIPGNGQPIIMLSDCQTTGGYTKLCFVITPDLDILAQCKPGGKIKFAVVTDDEAILALKEYLVRVDKVKKFVSGTETNNGKHYILKINGTKYDVWVEG